ncbi:hypothetical protein [Acinetobacter sp. CFCC 10889]|uniref:hypothetical protein n=1 Tax=Acinetobacter sp. CFCC 10889 TaxID=1775557 RepID=UPI000DCFC0BF|nr:hypothetical protein [Acinetobacter sp. CFCC 10889]
MNRKTQQDMQDVLQCFYQKKLPPLGLKYAEALFKITPDLSDESLQKIDTLLITLHQQNIRPNDLVTTKDGLNFLMAIIGYLCEVITQRTHHPVEWYNYYEAIKILPSDYELPLDFFSSMVALINKQVCLPLTVISDVLHHGETAERTCLSYVHARQAVIEKRNTQNINENCAEYIQALQQHRYIQGGNAYRKATDLIDFDFSLVSIQKIDLLLNSIRQHERLNEAQYATFMQDKEKLNFLVALSYYLGTTIAHQTLSSVKWFSFEEYKALLSQDEDESFRYELAQIFVFQNQISYPMSVLSSILFDSNQPAQSCLDYVQKYIALSTQSLVYFPSSLKDIQQPEITANITRAFKHAGFLAGYASFMLDGSGFDPCLLVNKENKVQIIKLMQENSREIGLSELERNPHGYPFQLFCEDIHAYLPTGRTDAIYLKIQIYAPTETSVSLVIPYTKNADNKIEYIYSAVQYTPTDLSLAQFDAAMTTFYQNAFEFQDSFTQQSFWQAHFQENIVRKPATFLLNDIQNHEFILSLKTIFPTISAETPQAAPQVPLAPDHTAQITQASVEIAPLAALPDVNNPALLTALDILATNEGNPEKSQQAIGIISSLIMNDDPEAMQLMAHFHAEGKYVEKDNKQAFFYLVEVAKLQMDESSFKDAMRFYASPLYALDKTDPDVEEWLLSLAADFDRATAEKPEIGQLNGSTSYRRHIHKVDQPLTTAQWVNRILIGISVVLILIILIK